MAIRCAVVGLGMGRHHARLISEVEGLDLACVCDMDAARRREAAEQFGVKGVASFEEVLADEGVDLVSIVTSHDAHCEMAVKALKAGKHTVLDKPFCLTVGEADKMIAARDKAGKMLSCFHCRRWDSDYLTVKQALETGAIGELMQVQINQAGFHAQRRWRAVRKHMGGLFYDWGAHFADQLCQIAGAPCEAVTAVTQYGPHKDEVEDFIHVAARFGGGVHALVSQSGMSYFAGPRWVLSGRKGSMRVQDQGHGGGGDAAGAAEVRAKLKDVVVDMQVPKVEGDWKSYYENVSAHLNEGKRLDVTAEQARDAIELIQAAYISAETGKTVSLPLAKSLRNRKATVVRGDVA